MKGKGVSPISIVHIYLYRNLVNISRGESYVDTGKGFYAMKKSLFHNIPKIFYRKFMIEMEERGFVRHKSNRGYFIIRNRKNLKMLNIIQENIFPISLFSE
jgi:hypothetical protein